MIIQLIIVVLIPGWLLSQMDSTIIKELASYPLQHFNYNQFDSIEYRYEEADSISSSNDSLSLNYYFDHFDMTFNRTAKTKKSRLKMFELDGNLKWNPLPKLIRIGDGYNKILNKLSIKNVDYRKGVIEIDTKSFTKRKVHLTLEFKNKRLAKIRWDF